jgi:hypothetical protein
MTRARQSPEEIRSLQDLANPGLLRPTLPDGFKAKFVVMALGGRNRDYKA